MHLQFVYKLYHLHFFVLIFNVIFMLLSNTLSYVKLKWCTKIRVDLGENIFNIDFLTIYLKFSEFLGNDSIRENLHFKHYI